MNLLIFLMWLEYRYGKKVLTEYVTRISNKTMKDGKEGYGLDVVLNDDLPIEEVSLISFDWNESPSKAYFWNGVDDDFNDFIAIAGLDWGDPKKSYMYKGY